MHEMIHRALASQFERDRLTAARASRSLEQAKEATRLAGARPRRRFARRLLALRLRHQ